MQVVEQPKLKPIGPFVKGQIVGYVEREQRETEALQAMRQWHVLLIEPQQERRAQAYLIPYRFKVYVPTMPAWTTRGVRRTKLQVERPMFPGYMFIRFDPDLDDSRRYRIDMAPGVREFMKLDGHHAIISEDDLARVQAVEIELHKPKPKVSHYEVGEFVRIGEGSFTGFNAEVWRLDDDERITVLLSLLGQATKVTLPVSDIEKL